MKQKLISLIASIAMAGTMAQGATVPRLVVGITIDQLRSDYLDAFSSLYGEDGFKRLFREGQIYSNIQYPYANVDRASAIASLMTGTVPYYHGIVAEEWIDRKSLQKTYCVDDKEAKGQQTAIGSSPKNLLVTTIGDELKLATAGKSLVYSVSPFREASILAAGHAANWAMWIDDETGKWAGTSYYGTQPSWIKDFCSNYDISNKVSNVKWQPYNSNSGTYNYYYGSQQRPFNHSFGGNKKYTMYKTSALVNAEITRAAEFCITNGGVGSDNVTDFLSICYYAGNCDAKGIHETSTELQDTYLRLDNEIANLLKDIDKLVGLDNTLIFITSTGYDDNQADKNFKKYNIPTGDFSISRCSALLNMYLIAMHGTGQYIESYFGNQIYLNHKLIEEKQLKISEILEHCEDFLLQFSGVGDVYTSTRLAQGGWTPEITKIRNGYNPKCSGDITIKVSPGWNLVNEDRGTSTTQRESFFEAPLIFIGGGITPEKITKPVSSECVAPTIAHAIRIRAPNGCSSEPLF